jgi:PEP-CTERM/exosortase A-associated glycosyltransferase
MRVVHILDHSLPVQSGYTYRTLAILREQGSMGWHTLQLTSRQPPDAQASMEVVDGWQFFRTLSRPSPPWTPRFAQEYLIIRATGRRLDQLARHWRPHVLHAHSPVRNAMAALIVGRKLNIPVVYEIRALWEDAASSHGTMRDGALRYALARRLETHAVRHANALVTISHGLRRDLCGRGVREDKVFLVPNAVDVTRFVPEERAEVSDEARTRNPVIGFIGSFYSYEGLDLLLEAARRIVADRPEIRFLLVGGGPEERRLRELSASGNMGAYMTFTGWLPHDRIVEAYRKIDIFVYPRRRNRLTDLVTPLKPLEAMAMAKVVLASDVGGHRELIEDGRTGFLFKADDVSELVVRLRGLLDASDTWPVIGAAARRFVERERTWRAVAATYAQVYDRACSRSRQAGVRQRP